MDIEWILNHNGLCVVKKITLWIVFIVFHILYDG